MGAESLGLGGSEANQGMNQRRLDPLGDDSEQQNASGSDVFRAREVVSAMVFFAAGTSATPTC